MSHRYIFRYDIWICLFLGFLASLGVEKLATNILSEKYEDHKAEHIVEAGAIGGKADESVFEAQNLSDLESHDTFTVISPGIEYRNRSGGYHDGKYFHALTLPSGEIVAALINTENVTKKNPSDDYFTGDTILPIGTIVREDLPNDSSFLHQIEFKEPLSTRSFYVDMIGNGLIKDEDSFITAPVLLFQVLTIIIVFAILHLIGSKIGLFPAFYTKKSSKSEKTSDWD